MSKINIFSPVRLRNSGHFQFHTEFRAAVEEAGPAELELAEAWPKYVALYESLDAALKKIVKSEYSDRIKEADAARDAAFSGFTKFLAAMREHYDAAIRDAAQRVFVVAHTYGNVAVKPINEETSDIYNLVQELKTAKYAADVAQIGLTPWVDKLEAANIAFESLIRNRDREAASKNHADVRAERLAIDEAYGCVVDFVNAQIYFGRLTGIGAFVDTLNAVIHRYSKKHGHHKRGAEADAEGSEDESAVEAAA